MYSLSHLPNQQQGEKGIIVLRRHWFTFFTTLLRYFLFVALPLLALFVLQASNNSASLLAFAYPFVVVFLSIYYLSIWTFLFHEFMDYYLDLWVITTERILAIEQKGLFSRVISEQKLFRVQDVTSEVHGVFKTFLRFGNVYIQTAGQQQRFIFKDVPHPEEVAKLILDEAHKCKLRHPEENSDPQHMNFHV